MYSPILLVRVDHVYCVVEDRSTLAGASCYSVACGLLLADMLLMLYCDGLLLAV